jgi:hypothetical protein
MSKRINKIVSPRRTAILRNVLVEGLGAVVDTVVVAPGEGIWYGGVLDG